MKKRIIPIVLLAVIVIAAGVLWSARRNRDDDRVIRLSGNLELTQADMSFKAPGKLIARLVYRGPIRAPIAAGQEVGVVRVWRGANVAMEAPVYAADAVGTGSTMRRAIDGASELVIGMFRAGAEKL